MLEDIKSIRREMLREVDKWEKLRCEKCRSGLPNKKLVTCGCEAGRAVRAIGVKLDRMGSPAKYRKVESVKKRALSQFGKEIYVEMKSYEMTDTEIYKLIGWTRKEFLNWKRESDFVQKFRKGHRIGQKPKEGMMI